MRKTSVLIVLIKNMNVRYSIHLRSPSANSLLGAGLQGEPWLAGRGDVSEGRDGRVWGD